MGKPFDCRRRGLVYETNCLDCYDQDGNPRARYVGETARSLAEMYSDHIEDSEKSLKASHMYKHWMVHHQGTRTRFKVEVIGFFSTVRSP